MKLIKMVLDFERFGIRRWHSLIYLEKASPLGSFAFTQPEIYVISSIGGNLYIA